MSASNALVSTYAKRRVTQIYDCAFRPLDLRSTQFTVLAIARIRGNLSMTELADNMVTDRTTLSRNLRPLEKRGLIRIDHGPDRRTKMITVTRKGMLFLSQAFPIWQAVQNSVVGQYGALRFQALLRDLGELTHIR
ncbi:MAG: MarR family winged helix-turn-helix transcriptional regulator [Blastocatellia bacterium]